jgi:hypothetical protein
MERIRELFEGMFIKAPPCSEQSLCTLALLPIIHSVHVRQDPRPVGRRALEDLAAEAPRPDNIPAIPLFRQRHRRQHNLGV